MFLREKLEDFYWDLQLFEKVETWKGEYKWYRGVYWPFMLIFWLFTRTAQKLLKKTNKIWIKNWDIVVFAAITLTIFFIYPWEFKKMPWGVKFFIEAGVTFAGVTLCMYLAIFLKDPSLNILRWLGKMAKKIEGKKEAEVRIQLIIALGIGIFLGLNWGDTMVDIILISVLWFLAIIFSFIAISNNAEDWPGWLWTKTAMAEVGNFFEFLFIYSVIFPVGLLFLKVLFPPRDRCEECGKKRKVSVFFDSMGSPIVLCDNCSKYLKEICLVEKEVMRR